MNKIDLMIEKRGVPSILVGKDGKEITTKAEFEERRKEMKELLSEHEYGKIPESPDALSVKEVSVDERFAAGKTVLKNLEFTVTVGGEAFSFPVVSVIPQSEKKLPAFVHINFRPDVPDKYMPSEELADLGFAVFSFCYNDVTRDNGDFSDGVAKLLCPSRDIPNAPGKIAMWAWAAMRVMDYIETLDAIDKENVAVIGHSRLGKTALVTGAFDDRFKFVISNDSGCSGAAVTRGKIGEDILTITNRFPFWFCPRYSEYKNRESELPFEQHFLLAASAPRHVLIGSAEEDTWADPESEFLSAHLASEVYRKIYGGVGLVSNGEIPKAPSSLDDGDIHYHVRRGLHYFSREDWLRYIAFIKKHL